MDKITSALAAGSGALQLIKKLRSFDEVDVSNKPWNVGTGQRHRWGKAVPKLIDKIASRHPKSDAIRSKLNQIISRRSQPLNQQGAGYGIRH